MDDDDEQERSFCFIEGTLGDKMAAEEISEFQETVWFKMKPPKPCRCPYTFFVSARQIDLVRALLAGPKIKVPEKTCEEQPQEEEVATRRVPSREKLSLNKAKSSVRFLSTIVYDSFDT